MWVFEKKLEFPVKINNKNPALAKLILEQYGGPDGELGAALRYLSQRFSMVTDTAKATLNDIGTEELAHLEMIGSIVHQLTDDVSSIDESFAPYYVSHGLGVYPAGANGMPFTAAALQSKGDPITDLYENMAAEQKARSTYEYLMKMTNDPSVLKPLSFLREREIVHFQRFGESLEKVRDYLSNEHTFVMPGFDNNKNNCKNTDKSNANNGCNKN